MALPLVVIRIYAATRTLLEAGSQLHSKTWSDLWQFKAQEATEEGLGDLEYAARSTFGMLADTGRANAMAWDVVLSAIVIALWAALAEASPRIMFRCTLLPWLRDESAVAFEKLDRTIKLDPNKKRLHRRREAACFCDESHSICQAERSTDNRNGRSIRSQAWPTTQAPEKRVFQREWVLYRPRPEQEP
jgi:hypothetical protein